jgi:hypothetical protein
MKLKFVIGLLFVLFLQNCRVSSLAPSRPEVTEGQTALKFVDHSKALQTGCVTCHENVRPQSRPSHGNSQDCNLCHKPDFIKDGVRSWKNLLKVDHTVGFQSCNRCHLSVERDSRPAPKESHPTAKYAQLDCIVCHQYSNTNKPWKNITFNQRSHSPSPKSCNQCHEATRPNSHIINPKTPGMKTTDCFACHGSSTNWKDQIKQYDHLNSAPTACLNCHKNDAPKPTENHPSKNENYSKLECNLCHTFNVSARDTKMSWKNLTFDSKKHTPISNNCSSCHNSAINNSLPKNGSHNITSRKNLTCNECHNFAEGKKWTSFATFKHTKTESSETCESCHNGATATLKYKTATHIPTKLTCIECHNSNAWKPAMYKHLPADVLCLTCHNGKTASGRPATHTLKTEVQCNVCHDQNRWAPAWYDGKYIHDAKGNMPPQESRGKVLSHPGANQCNSCHETKKDSVRYKDNQYAPACLGCHVRDLREADFHRGHERDSQIQDCLKCHNYRTWDR